MLVKVCGISESNFVHRIDELDVEFIGFIFYEKSKRYLADKISGDLIKTIPKEINKVGVFVNEDKDKVLKHVHKYQLDFVQLHGDEDEKYVQNLSRNVKVIKVFRIDEYFNFNTTKSFEGFSHYFLFDTKAKEYGGTGRKFNWDLINRYNGNTPFLLSGGINREDTNHIKEFRHSKFIGIDINSGFEVIPGIKDINKIKIFLNQLS